MMQDNIDISELYNEGAISGETYLYCVENNINTIADLANCSWDEASDLVVSELETLLRSSEEDIKADVTSQDSVVVSEICSEEENSVDHIIPYIQSQYDNASEDLKYELDLLVKNHGSLYELTKYLLTVKSSDGLRLCEDIFASNKVCDIVYDLQTLGRGCSLIDQLFLTCTDVRSTNVLKARYEYFGNKLDFINWILSCNRGDIMRLPNVGRKSLDIIWDAIEPLREIAKQTRKPLIETSNKIEQPVVVTSEEIASFILLLDSKRNQLSVRANNVLSSILADCSYEEVLIKFKTSPFVFASAKNCGRKTNYELCKFRDEILTLIKTTHPQDVEYQVKFDKYKSLLSLPKEDIHDLINLIDTSHVFPLFYVIQKYIDNLQHRDHTILYGMLDLYNNQELRHREELGKEFKLTGERVRQLRGKILTRLQDFILVAGKAENIDHYSPDLSNEINLKEGTNFQDNFIYWVISLLNKDWVLIGDIEDVFFNPHGHQINFNIVPSHLWEAYNFTAFIKSFNELYYEKRTVSEELDLSSYCLKFFRGSIQIALLDDVVYACKKVIYRLYDCTSSGNIIILESNAYRGLCEISEEILRECGSPMTADEMYAVLLEKYPNQRCKGASSLVGSIHNNPNILPMGRSRTYSLKEWNLGTKRGGTIREFAEECILMQPDRIASLDEIGNYVRQFRETSSNSSIQANLMLEASGKFALFTKEDQKYIGFSGREYDSCYIPAEESMVIVRSFETSTRLLIQFIEENGRYPFMSGDDVEESEKRLGRFLRNVRYRCKNGVGTAEDHEFIKYLESAYPYQEIPRHEYKWREFHSSICETLREYGRDGLTPTEQQWCYKYLRMLRQGQLEDWQVPLMIKLQSLYA